MSEFSSSPEITMDDRFWSALAYPLAPLAIFLLLVDEKKSRPFIKYHAIQALAVSIPLYVLSTILAFSVVGFCILPLLWTITFFPAFDAYQGNYTSIPTITNLLKNQGML